ncbi:hypothetical protein WJX84_001068 [Apatococcus fuscideae]|uniref:aspartate--tRNA ligase n=1 Tax=Apatococcus fuscideae TaxID=2026836 RepID=A0AAW1TFV3_9CHLO
MADFWDDRSLTPLHVPATAASKPDQEAGSTASSTASAAVPASQVPSVATPPVSQEDLPVAKNAGKRTAAKEDKKAKKAEKLASRQKAEVPTQSDPSDPLHEKYGDPPLIQSRAVTGRKWTNILSLTPALADQEVLVRGNINAVRGKGNSAFLVLRQGTATAQAILFKDDKTVSKGMVKYASALSQESVVEVEAIVRKVDTKVEACTQSEVELKVTGIHCLSRAGPLPFTPADAARSQAELDASTGPDGEKLVGVAQDTRLDNRILDLRTPANQAIFRIQSAVGQLFRELLLSEGFQEIHTPKLIGGASEGGASVFTLQYFGQPGCLAQSPQLYKQMALMGGMDRVFEVGPVFRAENSMTHRHMTEFMGLDFEMTIHEHYFEVLEVIERLFTYLFDGLHKRWASDQEAIGKQYPFEPFRWLPNGSSHVLRMNFDEAIKILQDNGFPEAQPLEDLSTELERELGKIIKKTHNTDFYIIQRFPMAVRPFYTMPDPEDPRWSNSFDVFMRGEEIISGAQRVHDSDLLAEQAAKLGIPVASIQSYIDSFKYGAHPHGGAGVGLERVVMLFCGLNNIRKTSLFPRDPKRLTP